MHLSNIITNKLGKTNKPFIHIEFLEYKGKKICKVTVEKAPKPCYLKEENKEKFYVRLGNNTNELQMSELTDYIENHW